MNLESAMLELVIAARERGEMDDTRLRQACRAIETRLETLRERQRRRQKGRACARCYVVTRSGMLCDLCLGSAPATVRRAFQDAVGVEGMRRATALVQAYAAGKPPKQARRLAA